MYKFIAEMRDGRVITLCEWNDIQLFRTLMSYFNESDNISRFAIEKNNEIVEEKYLPTKEKPRRRRKVR